MKGYSRRQVLTFLSVGATALCVSVRTNAADIIVARDGTFAEALCESGRVMLDMSVLNGTEQCYVAALDGRELRLSGANKFVLWLNGQFVLHPMHTLRVQEGDRISIKIEHV